MEQSLSLRIGNFLYQHAYPIYKPVYFSFKKRQDAHELAFIRKVLRPSSVVLDIGANIGFYTLNFSKLIGDNGKVYAFEPDLLNFKHLSDNLQGVANVLLHNMAVSNKDGELTMFVSHRLNVDNRTYEPGKYKSSYKVRSVSIDDMLPAGTKVDFIKMDIQGSEYLALQGMERTLKENPDCLLLCEYAPEYLLKCSGTTPQQFETYLKDLGFNLYFLRDGKLSAFEPIVKAGNGDVYYENVVATKLTPNDL